MNCVINAWGEHEAEIRGFLVRQTGSPVMAEDILQDTFLRAIAEGGKFCTLENPRAWLFRVARNRLIDTARRNENKLKHRDLPEDLPEKKEEAPVIASLDVCLPRALKELTAEDRDAIESCDLNGMKQADFAKNKGLSLAGAKSRVQRARKRLKAELVKLCQVNYDEAGNICCFKSKQDSSLSSD